MPPSPTTAHPSTTPSLCWICGSQPANSGEHRFKASDLRARVPGLAHGASVFLQRGRATNNPIISAKSRKLKYPKSICTTCNDKLTQSYDVAWETLSEYLLKNWDSISRRGSFDLSKPFSGRTRAAALDVHLFFVKLFGCKIQEGGVPIDLAPFSRALLTRTAHPEVSLLVSADNIGRGHVVMHDSEVHTWENQLGRLDCAIWLYSLPPAGVRVSYLRSGAPVQSVGRPWHPGSTGKIVRLSAALGAKIRPSKSNVLLPPT